MAVVGAGFLFPVLHLCLAGLRGGDSRAAPLLDVVRLAPYRRALVHSLGVSAAVAAPSVARSPPAAVFLAPGDRQSTWLKPRQPVAPSAGLRSKKKILSRHL
ncbi:MAG TPA: hypothetical protein PLW65_27485, partial [Pseudomonadota bacterium]|nr:hypothetical protein [Pseudomonadota bacterium]